MRSRLLLAVIALLAAGGCGTRMDHSDVMLADRAAGPGRGGATSNGRSLDGAAPSAAASATDSVAAAGSGGSTGAAAVSTGRAGASTGSVTPAPTHESIGNGAARSPVKVASISTLSGPAGAVLAPQLDGVRAWVRYVNDRGGVNGHAVNLLVVDDGADPARHRAAVQRAVETDHVLALLHDLEALTGGSSVAYLTSKRVPVIGSETGSPWFYTSPVYFPQATSGRYLNDAAIVGVAPEAIARGKRKWGVLACVEAQNCRQVFQDGGDVARSAGLEPVFRAQVSLAQPDFTAECLAASNAKVEILFLGLDQNSIDRVAQSCARAGFRPIYELAAPLVFAKQAKNPNLAGTLATSVVFPWFQDNTPATAEFQTATGRYLSGESIAVSQALGWTSAKLFERAMAAVPEPPTRESLLQALWSIKADTLGGLTMPLTFTPNQPPKPRLCWFTLEIRDGHWVNNDGFKLNCN